ncbi:MAG: hypothetical protein ACREH5_05580 [Candidatus Omnitrophota bacterium]
MGLKRLLIAGVPATGKTTVGRYLGSERSFLHIDFEDRSPLWNEFLITNPAGLIDDFSCHGGDLVVTWGFAPEAHSIRVVKIFKEKGFDLIWFDGNRQAALREFLRREGGDTRAFREQLKGIRRARVLEKIRPVVVNTFDPKGRFRDLPAIAAEVVAAGSGAP